MTCSRILILLALHERFEKKSIQRNHLRHHVYTPQAFCMTPTAHKAQSKATTKNKQPTKQDGQKWHDNANNIWHASIAPPSKSSQAQKNTPTC
eukprot:4319805-Amphidinium_carterae.1